MSHFTVGIRLLYAFSPGAGSLQRTRIHSRRQPRCTYSTEPLHPQGEIRGSLSLGPSVMQMRQTLSARTSSGPGFAQQGGPSPSSRRWGFTASSPARTTCRTRILAQPSLMTSPPQSSWLPPGRSLTTSEGLMLLVAASGARSIQSTPAWRTKRASSSGESSTAAPPCGTTLTVVPLRRQDAELDTRNACWRISDDSAHGSASKSKRSPRSFAHVLETTHRLEPSAARREAMALRALPRPGAPWDPSDQKEA
mmetsp:Transcript_8152/g.23935  ORF Transcript_8152/g.23935 Transcript_8152/m.23935 type:complete len:252 (-) Transcript_8152:2-757(-)